MLCIMLQAIAAILRDFESGAHSGGVKGETAACLMHNQTYIGWSETTLFSLFLREKAKYMTWVKLLPLQRQTATSSQDMG